MTAPRAPHHRLDGPESAPPLILGPSLGTSLAVWQPQLPGLTRGHRVLRWDLPGHGGSPADLLPGEEATVGRLAGLVLAAADRQGWDRFGYAGISLGGAVGAYLAAHHPERVEALAVVCSSARFGEPSGWHDRARLVRERGTAPLLETAPGRWFADPAATARTPWGATVLDDLAETDPRGYAACCEALAGYDLRDRLAGIAAPTLVVAGRDDPATPPPHARELADGIPGADLLELARAAHLAGIERPAAVTAALAAHFAPAPAADPRPTDPRGN
ncbi:MULTISPECIES: 3-oxoadipate enol-lactonase [Streptomyces]|uniref:3-oxoadipate enol-lactonase n=1 Tax=Streptomyces lycii TaxID=2654337 RepID=A0ABQ7FLN6_9ACTN|nr:MULTISPECIES: 3-oxoadipate enol-lactonase [Streptomyces]KAF4409876.1 3-oxoadipate enol-lactonase [Streptomyces lycii]PGH50028.1 3-oxoadipate enol-lactonase [Streptomyces sp. Ru87]